MATAEEADGAYTEQAEDHDEDEERCVFKSELRYRLLFLRFLNGLLALRSGPTFELVQLDQMYRYTDFRQILFVVRAVIELECHERCLVLVIVNDSLGKVPCNQIDCDVRLGCDFR